MTGRDRKINSTNRINDQKLVPGKFAWQEGFGAFINAKLQGDNVVHYILKLPEHNKRRTFKVLSLGILSILEIR